MRRDFNSVKLVHTTCLIVGTLVIPGVIGYLIAVWITKSTYPESTQIWFYPGLLFGVFVGALLFSMLPFRIKWIKVIAILTYMPIMLYVIWFLIYPWFHNSGASYV